MSATASGPAAASTRLRQVVVRAQLEAEELVQLVVAGGQHDHRQVRIPADGPGDVEAVEAGQAEVEHDEIRPIAPDRGQGGLAVGRRAHGEPSVLEIVAGEVRDLRLIVHDEDRLHRRPS